MASQAFSIFRQEQNEWNRWEGGGKLSPGPVLVSFAFRIDNILINYASMAISVHRKRNRNQEWWTEPEPANEKDIGIVKVEQGIDL